MDRDRPGTGLEQVMAVVALLLLTEGPLLLFLTGGASQGDGRPGPESYPLIQASFLVIYVATGLVLLRSWRDVLTMLSQEKFVLALLVIVGASVLWSGDPALTGRRIVAFGGTTLVGIHLAVRYRVQRQLQLLAWACGVSMVLSVTVTLCFPDFGIMGGPIHPGSWRGIYAHKNTLGRIVAMSLLVFVMLAPSGGATGRTRTLLWGGAAVSLVLLVFSTSKAAMLNAVIVLGLVAALGMWLRVPRVVPAALASLVVASGIFVLEVSGHWTLPRTVSRSIESVWHDGASPAAARSDSLAEPPRTTDAPSLEDGLANLTNLSGRSELWGFLLDDVKARPWLGYGYGAFWRAGADGPSAAVLRRVPRWSPPHAHNGFLDVWLNTGLLGLVVLVCGLGTAATAAIRQVVELKTWLSGWPLVSLAYVGLVNLSESALMRQNQILWSLFVAAVLSLSVGLPRDRPSGPRVGPDGSGQRQGGET